MRLEMSYSNSNADYFQVIAGESILLNEERMPQQLELARLPWKFWEINKEFSRDFIHYFCYLKKRN